MSGVRRRVRSALHWTRALVGRGGLGPRVDGRDRTAPFVQRYGGSGLRYVAGVSWPRSGHHLLVRLLEGYFGDSFGYCESYSPADCCRRFPCTRRPAINFTKNHDWKLDLPKIPGLPYVVQYRDFLPSTISDFELYVRNGNEDSAASFERYCHASARRYRAFVEKWVLDPLPAERMVVKYEEFVSDPETVMARIVPFFATGTVPDLERLRLLVHGIAWVRGKDMEKIENHGVQDRRDVTAFRYYDRAFLDPLLDGLRDLP